MIDLKIGTKGAAFAGAPKITVKQIIRFYLSLYKECTRRELSAASGVEIATLCAGLKALEDAGHVHVAKTTTCKTTGREVAVYSLTHDEEVL